MRIQCTFCAIVLNGASYAVAKSNAPLASSFLGDERRLNFIRAVLFTPATYTRVGNSDFAVTDDLFVRLLIRQSD